MKKKLKIFICIMFLLLCVKSYSQTITDSIVFVEICNFENCIKDTVIFYNDSTFKDDVYGWWMSGLVHFYTSGKYTVSDSIILMTSFIEYKRTLTVKEGVDSCQKRVYEWDYDSSTVYYGRMGFIIELDKEHNQFSDTLFFYPTKEFRVESLQKECIGFIIYVSNEFAGEYIFKNSDSNKITLWFSDYNYMNEKKNVYVKDAKFLIINDNLIQSPETGRFFVKQK